MGSEPYRGARVELERRYPPPRALTEVQRQRTEQLRENVRVLALTLFEVLVDLDERANALQALDELYAYAKTCNERAA